MEIRRATTADIPAVQSVAEASWEHDYPELLSRETAVDGVHEWYSEDRVETEIDEEDSLVLLAERNDDVAGFVHAAWSGDEGDVLRVYVDPDHRGDGVGSALLESAVASLFERDIERVRAMVLSENEAGNQFYRDHGFENVGDTSKTEIAGERYEENAYALRR